MKRLILTKSHNGRRAGAEIEVDDARAERLIADRVAKPKPAPKSASRKKGN